MTDDAQLSFRDILAGIERRLEEYRNETRTARHEQANNTQRAMAELEGRLGGRLTTLEMTLARNDPTSLGPRLNTVEQYQARAEVREQQMVATVEGINRSLIEARGHIDALQTWKDKASGAWAVVGGISVILGIIAVVIAWLP